LRLSDPLQLLISRYPGKSQVLAAVGVVVGTLAIGYDVHDIATIPWEVDSHSPTVLSSSVHCGTFSGAVHVIDVQGQTFECGGGDTKCGAAQHVPVAFDPQAPSRCRVASNVGRPTLDQIGSLLGGLVWLAFAGAVISWVREGRVGVDEGAHGKRSWGYRVSRAVLIASATLGLIVWLTRTAIHGGTP
jgi:hypothetical protein